MIKILLDISYPHVHAAKLTTNNANAKDFIFIIWKIKHYRDENMKGKLLCDLRLLLLP